MLAAVAATGARVLGRAAMGTLAAGSQHVLGARARAAAPSSAVPDIASVTAADVLRALEDLREDDDGRSLVGALTFKPIAFKYRKWEMQRHEAVCTSDASGANVFVYTKQHTPSPYDDSERLDPGAERIIRVMPRPNEDFASDAVSDKTRFAFEGLYRNRLADPEFDDGQGTRLFNTADVAFAVVTGAGSEPPFFASPLPTGLVGKLIN